MAGWFFQLEGNCIEVRFDGKKCTHTGPEIVPVGPVTFILNNQSSGMARLVLDKLAEGKTWEDMVDYLGSPLPSTQTRPDWSEFVGHIYASDGQSGTNQVELAAGTYYWVCNVPAVGLWPGAPLIVEE